MSVKFPVGRNLPVEEPETFIKFNSTGADEPGTPSIAISPV